MDIHDKRHARGRFGWVKRLVQGQNRPMEPGERHHNYEIQYEKQPRASTGEQTARKSLKSVDFASDEESQGSFHSDNVSTVPLKLIVSHSSTTNPLSILSGEPQNDNSSYVASTADTSLAPSMHGSLLPGVHGLSREATATRERDRERDRDRERERDRDSESIVTLASLSRRMRRRSIDTNGSMAGIAPASIMERLTVNPMSPGSDEVEQN